MKLIIVRHAETTENIKNIMTGWLDVRLSEDGIAQAKKLAKRLADEKIDFVYSSDLGRTKETVKEILRYHKCPIIYDPLLREKNQGTFEGRPREEYSKFRKTIRNPYWRPEGGENFYDVKRRVRKFIEYLQKTHGEEDSILIMTHGGWKNAFFSYLFDIPRSKAFLFQFDNTAVSIVNIHPNGRHEVKVANCTKHLSEGV